MILKNHLNPKVDCNVLHLHQPADFIWKKFLIDKDFTIKKAFKYLNNTSYKCLIVVEKKNNFLLGTISDGDIRKAILNGINLKDKVSKIYNKKPYFLIENSFSNQKAKEILLKHKLSFIPIVNKMRKVNNIFDQEKSKFTMVFEPIDINSMEKYSNEFIDFNERMLRKIELVKRSLLKTQRKSEDFAYLYVMSNKSYQNIYKMKEKEYLKA